MNDESNAAVEKTLQASKIIGLALALGVAVFLAVVIVVRKDKPPQGNALLSYMGVCFAVVCLGAAAFVPTMIARAGVQSMADAPSIEKLATVFQTSFIVRAALIEGAAFLNGTFYLIYGDWLNCLVTLILLGLLIYFIPTKARFLNWVRRIRESNL